MANSLDDESGTRKWRRRRVVLFPYPLQGHLNPMLQLASILHSSSNGYLSITIIHTKFNSPNPLNYPHFNFLSIPDGLSGSETSTEDVIALFSLLVSKCFVPFKDGFTRLLENAKEQDEEDIACLITDGIWHFTQGIADGLNVPRLVLRTSSVSSFLAFAAFPIFLQKGYLPIQESRLEESIQEIPPLKVKDIPIMKTRIPYYFYDFLATMDEQIKLSKGLIFNSYKDLEDTSLSKVPQHFPIPLFPIGPFHKYFPANASSLLAQDPTSISWLDKQAPKSVLYVSFGSIAAIDAPQFLEIARGLANSKQPFLWVVRPGLVHGSEWIEPLPVGFVENLQGRGYGRGHIVKWAPQDEVLAHPNVGGFWTHNGWNSTLESICEGVPMICSPCFADQMVNSRYVCDVWKIGLPLEINGSLRREEVEQVIGKLMVGKEGEAIQETITKIKEKADHCLKPGGSSYLDLHKLISYIMSF